MPVPLTAAELAAKWPPERIAENMKAEHGVTWAPPPVEATLVEEEAAIREYVAAAVADAGPATEWQVMDPVTMEPRNLTEDELFDLSAAVEATMPAPAPVNTLDSPAQIVQDIRDHADDVLPQADPQSWGWRGSPELPAPRELPGYDSDFLAGLPREVPTSGQVDTVQAAMKDYGVPAETRAQARWEARMNPEQSRAQALAVATHHPSALRPVQ
jgi:hypothetical protein